MDTRVTRRRAITIAAAAGCFGWSLASGRPARAAEPPFRVWRGRVLGAEASILVAHPEHSETERLIRLALSEIERLERLFSLHRPNSEIVRLNRAGSLEAPSPEMAELIECSLRYASLTGGAFDVTVQPLWEAYWRHFAKTASESAPREAAIARARARVGWHGIETGRRRIRLSKPGMAITLNGIAQGYITDAVAERLRDGGMTSVLLDLGEFRALGHHPAGRPWRVGIALPGEPQQVFRAVDLVDRALATSGAYGTAFDGAARFNHIFDPATGLSGRLYASVSVLAPTATAADALSTALAVMERDAIAAVLARVAGTTAIIRHHDGEVTLLGAPLAGAA